MRFTESTVEDAALAWLESLGYAVLHLPAPPACAGHADMQSNAARQAGGPAIAAGEPAAERSDPNYRDVALDQRLRQALVRPNTDMPPEALEHACRKLTLTPARDTLLPKLVFGELRVRDAGRFINKHP